MPIQSHGCQHFLREVSPVVVLIIISITSSITHKKLYINAPAFQTSFESIKIYMANAAGTWKGAKTAERLT